MIRHIPFSYAKNVVAFVVLALLGLPSLVSAQSAYLEITLKVDTQDRAAAAAVYTKYKQPFLTTFQGAKSKELLIRDEDVQVLHGFSSSTQAEAYLKSDMFTKDVVRELKPYLKAAPEIRIYSNASKGGSVKESPAYLEITLHVAEADRPAAVQIYEKYKSPFLNSIDGAQSKQLLVRGDDVQVLHGFAS